MKSAGNVSRENVCLGLSVCLWGTPRWTPSNFIRNLSLTARFRPKKIGTLTALIMHCLAAKAFFASGLGKLQFWTGGKSSPKLPRFLTRSHVGKPIPYTKPFGAGYIPPIYAELGGWLIIGFSNFSNTSHHPHHLDMNLMFCLSMLLLEPTHLVHLALQQSNTVRWEISELNGGS